MNDNETLIEIIDNDAGAGSPALIPNEVRINGRRVLLRNAVTVNGPDEAGGEFLSVTMTLVPSRLVFRALTDEEMTQ